MYTFRVAFERNKYIVDFFSFVSQSAQTVEYYIGSSLRIASPSFAECMTYILKPTLSGA